MDHTRNKSTLAEVCPVFAANSDLVADIGAELHSKDLIKVASLLEDRHSQ